MGIEPTQSAWKAEVLPLNYTRIISDAWATHPTPVPFGDRRTKPVEPLPVLILPGEP